MGKMGHDKQLQVFDKKAITNATVYSDPIVFADAAGADDAAGMLLEIRVDEDFTSSDVGSLVFAIQDSAAGSTYVARATSASFAIAALKKSAGGSPTLVMALPKGLAKYVRLAATLTNNMTAGKLSAILNTAV